MRKRANSISVENRYLHNPPGTKLIKRFIKRAKGEAIDYRKDLLVMKGLAARQKRFFRYWKQIPSFNELRLYPTMGAE